MQLVSCEPAPETSDEKEENPVLVDACPVKAEDVEDEETPFSAATAGASVQETEQEVVPCKTAQRDQVTILGEPRAHELPHDQLETPEKQGARPSRGHTPPAKRLRQKMPSADEKPAVQVASPVSSEPLPAASEGTCPDDLVDLAAKLLKTKRAQFANLKQMQNNLRKKQNPPGSVPGLVAACHICSAKRHRVKWLLRYKVCSGGLCYSCGRASVLLKCSRSPSLLEAAGLVPEFAQSSAYRAWLGPRDKCLCRKCAPNHEAQDAD